MDELIVTARRIYIYFKKHNPITLYFTHLRVELAVPFALSSRRSTRQKNLYTMEEEEIIDHENSPNEEAKGTSSVTRLLGSRNNKETKITDFFKKKRGQKRRKRRKRSKKKKTDTENQDKNEDNKILDKNKEKMIAKVFLRIMLFLLRSQKVKIKHLNQKHHHALQQ